MNQKSHPLSKNETLLHRTQWEMGDITTPCSNSYYKGKSKKSEVQEDETYPGSET